MKNGIHLMICVVGIFMNVKEKKMNNLWIRFVKDWYNLKILSRNEESEYD